MKKEKQSYPFTISDGGINYFKEYRENFEKCTAIIQSQNKNKTKGKVVNIFLLEYGKNGKKGIIITIEYKTKEGALKMGECYMDFPNPYPGLNEETDIYYVDDNYNFVYIDDIQFVDKETFIDSKEKLEVFTKEAKPVIISAVICLILSLVALLSVNSYLLLISTIVQFVLLFINLKITKKSIVFLHIVPYFINLFGIIFYSLNNINNLNIEIYITFVLHLIFVISVFIITRKK